MPDAVTSREQDRASAALFRRGPGSERESWCLSNASRSGEGSRSLWASSSGPKWDWNELVQQHLIDYARATIPNVGGITEL